MLGKRVMLHTFHPPYNFFNNSTSSHKEVTDEDQKKRVEKKNASLNVIRDLIINSSLISKDTKEECLTEVSNLVQPNRVELLWELLLSVLGVHTEVMFAAH